MGSTSPLGTGSGGFAADPQSAILPYSGTVSPDRCATGNLGTAALSTFDGGGISLSMKSAMSELPGSDGETSSASQSHATGQMPRCFATNANLISRPAEGTPSLALRSGYDSR